MPEAPASRLSTIERQAVLSAVLVVVSVLWLVLLGYLGFDTLSSARAYVGGEGLWSKAEKDAVYHLTRYATSRDPGEYDAFRQELAVPLGDRVARLELQRGTPNWDSVRAGFLRGRNHPDDIPGMGRFFRRFHQVDFVAEAIGYWTAGDSLIDRLQELGARLHGQIESPAPDSARIRAGLAEVNSLSIRLTRLEDGFSNAMGAGARWATRVFLVLLSVVAVLLLAIAGLSLRRASRRFEAAETSRRASEQQLRELIRHAQFGISRATLDGRILSANPAIVRMLGYGSEEELLNLDVRRDLYVEPGVRDQLLERLRTEGSLASETELRRKDGTTIQVRFHSRLIRDAKGTPSEVEGFVEDVTRQRMLEAQVRQAQKLELIGQLTGGIAHEFNNLLTVILSTAELLEQELTPVAGATRSDLADLTAAARRGANMVRRLLALSRDRPLQFQPQALGPLVEASAQTLRRLLPSQVSVEVETDPTAPPVRTDPAAVEQILLNLATNARDAMPSGGTLRIVTGRAAGQSSQGGPRVLLRVGDSGVGMSAQTLEKVFEPFFTTKPPGRGTGLGLTMVLGLVKQHGGTIEVDSTPDQGTEVRIYFPAAAAVPTEGAGSPAARLRGAGTLLLVEDEDALRRATQRLLEREGYRVIAARNGLEALRICEDPGAGVDVILSDIVMPEMNGTVMCEELRRLGIQIPVILTSGYTARDSGGPSTLPEGVPFIPKPWEMDDLLFQLQQALERSRPAPDQPPAES